MKCYSFKHNTYILLESVPSIENVAKDDASDTPSSYNGHSTNYPNLDFVALIIRLIMKRVSIRQNYYREVIEVDAVNHNPEGRVHPVTASEC
jgi:hypothetical protein